MALKPGGGRSPSTQSPPKPSPASGTRRPARDRRPASTPQAAATSIVRWGALVGGLVIIVDLASRAIVQRSLSADDQALVATIDDIANYLLFSALGIIVVRDTGIIYLGAIAGVFAALLDASVVALATLMAPPAGPAPAVEDVFITNLVIGTLFAGVSGVVYQLVQNWSGGRRPR
jgi:hypothetical protein